MTIESSSSSAPSLKSRANAAGIDNVREASIVLNESKESVDALALALLLPLSCFCSRLDFLLDTPEGELNAFFRFFVDNVGGFMMEKFSGTRHKRSLRT